MKVMPIRYVADLAAAARFYTALGLAGGDDSRSGNWLELGASAGVLALHITRESQDDDPGLMELAFVTEEPLEKVAARLTEAGFPPAPIMDENFGRSMLVRDPDGLTIQINEHDPDLYT
jgi:catechol 2,3-dioxygenase-like lactoylglutathione lyase family enzyme